jgi:hypothetical protein
LFIHAFSPQPPPAARYRCSSALKAASTNTFLSTPVKMSSPSSRRGTIDLSIRSLSFSSKPDIDISLRGSEGPFPCHAESFSTLDRIDGNVSITSRVDTTFEDLEISLLGKDMPFHL